MHGGPQPSTAPPYAGRRVLVVDDERFIRTLLARMLAELGLEVVGTAASGAEAVSLDEALSPDLITLDIAMPGMDGLEALTLILGRRPDARVLMSTSFSDRRYVADAVKRGARGYLTKPFDLAGIRDKLEQLFAPV
ncbi:MAG: response regulator [Candidatus Krumholzibacteriia bacterium]